MTRVGMVMGTPHYMSPEQVRGERADARSDVFALGCVFYELLTYRKPFDADSMHSVLFKVMQEEPPSVQELAPGIPAVLAQVVERAMSKDASQRFQNASEFRSALHRAMQAVASGQGETSLPDLGAPAPAAPSRSSDASASRSASARAAASAAGASRAASASGGRSQPRPAPPAPPAPRSSKAPLLIGGALLLVAVAGVGLLVARRSEPAATPPPPTTRPAQVDGLAQELARSQVELARRRAEAGDFRDAMRQAQRALKIDPANKDAQAILSRAKTTADQADQAAATARQAASAGDNARAADALWMLLGVEAGNAAAEEVAPKVESAFRGRADEARRAMTTARQAAEASKAATVLDTFKDGVDLARQAETEYKASRFATAARRFLTARERFERASRTTR
jgi:tetratricopeptide (TPR) repeat protein